MFTDGTIVWIKMADGRIEIVELANISMPKTSKRSAPSALPKKKKPTKTQLKVLEFLRSLGIEP